LFNSSSVAVSSTASFDEHCHAELNQTHRTVPSCDASIQTCLDDNDHGQSNASTLPVPLMTTNEWNDDDDGDGNDRDKHRISLAFSSSQSSRLIQECQMRPTKRVPQETLPGMHHV
jgi:hypothetical protein